MKSLLLIGAGGFIGSVMRYLLSEFIQGKIISGSHFGTFGVNIIGCFLIGILLQLAAKGAIASELRLFLAVGICGGFTTFSTFSTDTILLMRDGQLLPAFFYVAASVLLGLGAAFAGISLMKIF